MTRTQIMLANMNLITHQLFSVYLQDTW